MTDNQTIVRIEQIVTADDRTAVSYLLEILKTTPDVQVRNEAAIALMDWQVAESVPVLLALLDATETKGNRGTLIYALSAFDCLPFLSKIAYQLCTGDYEEMEMALSIFENLPHAIDSKIIDDCLLVLQIDLKEWSEIQRKFIRYALDILENYQS
jgi:hypothetical protein